MSNLPTSNPGTTPPGRWELMRDIAVLQVKLVVDGVRDLVLVPVSIGVGIYSLFSGGDRPGIEFYRLLRYGRRSDHLINLFGAADRVQGPPDADAPLPDIDDMVARVETFIVDEYKKGGITAQAKKQIDSMLDSVRGSGSKDESRTPPAGEA